MCKHLFFLPGSAFLKILIFFFAPNICVFFFLILFFSN